jgi:catalase
LLPFNLSGIGVKVRLKRLTPCEDAMSSPDRAPARIALGPLVLIALVVGAAAAAFAYTAGWLSPKRLTPNEVVDAFAPPGGPALGHRRNHVTGICFTGIFEANGAGSSLSEAVMFRPGQYPAIGRFNLATSDIKAPDASVRNRGMGLQIAAPGGQVWRMAVIDAPFFPVSTPQALYELVRASGSKDPGAMKAFATVHPEIAHFGAWAQSAPWTGSYAEEPYNSLDSFVFTSATGAAHVVRWSLLPATNPVSVPPEELAKRPPDFLEREIVERIKSGPLRWTLVIHVAEAGDPTADPSREWPQNRRAIEVGTLTVQDIEPEANGPCRDINYDPTVLPTGMGTSDDPFPAARSSAYRRSFDLRTAEAAHYPAAAPEGAP